MISLFKIAIKSLWNRKISFFLIVFSMALSVMLFLTVEKIRDGAKEGFSSVISQTDLIVGARGSGMELLLYSVFHIGNPIHNVSWQTYNIIKDNPAVKWTIPLSFGDSFFGFRVVATDLNFYEHYRFHGNKWIELKEGTLPKKIFDVVLGADVAKKKNLKLGDRIELSHGVADGPSIHHHSENPFLVVAILKETGTPVDRALFISLEGTEAIHREASHRDEQFKVKELSAFLLGMRSRIGALGMQRDINNYTKEPIMAIIPGVTLNQFWQIVDYIEVVFQLVSGLVVVIGLVGMMVSLYAALDSRRREMAILRAVGAGISSVVFLLVIESFIFGVLGCVLGYMLSYIAVFIVQPILLEKFGVFVPFLSVQLHEYYYLLLVLILSCVLGLVPARRAYKDSLTDGLNIKL
ncbi:ABC transporter permease [Spirobacillus cienkowskii]